MGHACLPRCGKSVQRRSAQLHTVGSKRNGLADVVARTKATVDQHCHPTRNRVNDLR